MKKITSEYIKRGLYVLIILIGFAIYFQEEVLKIPLIVKYVNQIDIFTTIINWLIILYLYEEYVGNENKTKRLEEKRREVFNRKNETLLKIEKELVGNKNKRYLSVQIKRFSMLVEKLEENNINQEYIDEVYTLVGEFQELLVEGDINQAKLIQKIYLIQDKIILEEFK